MLGPIKGNRYEALKSTFNTSEMACFCTDRTRDFDGNKGCLYDGVLDLTTCQGKPKKTSSNFLYVWEQAGMVAISPISNLSQGIAQI